MSRTKAKTVNILLENGTLNGFFSIQLSSWISGILYSAPRMVADKLLKNDACSTNGVYLLLSYDQVYIGNSSDLSKLIKRHKIGKQWCERVIILTTSNDELNEPDIEYLISKLAEKAKLAGSLDGEDIDTDKETDIDKFRKTMLDQYMEEALFLLELIGIKVFSKARKSVKSTTVKIMHMEHEVDDSITTSDSKMVNKKPTKAEKAETEAEKADTETGKELELRNKTAVQKYLAERGILNEQFFNYAKRKEDGDYFWLSPYAVMLMQEWDIVLNNQIKRELILLHIPGGTFTMADGFSARSENDKGLVLDIELVEGTLIDRNSDVCFMPYVVKIIEY